MSAFDPRDLPLVPDDAERCLPPIQIDADGQPVPDPREILGLPHGAYAVDEVAAAYREQLLSKPPESHPREARQAREARDRLTAPERFAERHLGILHVPDPDAWGLPRPGRADDRALTPEARLLGQAVLYTLVEEALWTEGLGQLFDETLSALQAQSTSA